MRNWNRFLGVLSAAALALLVFTPAAHADIIEIESATSCPGSLGGGLCHGTVPYQLSALLNLLSVPDSILNGTQKYVVTDDIGDAFSFMLTSTGQNNTGVANNGACQINGGATSLFNACSIVDVNHQSTSLGGGQINNMTFPVTISFSGASGLGKTFDLGFVSMQGASSVAVPEPGSLALLGSAMLLLGTALLRKRGLPQA